MAAALTQIVSVVGAVTISAILVKTLNLIVLYVRPSRLDRYAHKSLAGDEPWALVTGASGGIGRALTSQLAARGFNVVLHGRSREKLSRVTSELQEEFPGRSFRILIADPEAVAAIAAEKSGDSTGQVPVDFDAIRQELDDIRLTVVINNVGGGPANPSCISLTESPEATVTRNINLNALFPWHLSRVLLPNLMRNSPSVLINVSSMADQGLPLLATYGASKSFLMTATRALRLEMVMEGSASEVEVLGVRLGKVTGARGFTEQPSLFVPNAGTVAKAILARAGHDNGIVHACWRHAMAELLGSVMTPFPRSIQDKVYLSIMKQQREELDGGLKTVKQP
ncbi:hypothetical protein SLS62_003604 [Diatrype stigma]|uniref:Uncharacterized protein n=1 Tax=Diatrype stigma TaxID=117547 RepID=A0AAN9YR57_9PEZI